MLLGRRRDQCLGPRFKIGGEVVLG